jgi:hypothetical protein
LPLSGQLAPVFEKLTGDRYNTVWSPYAPARFKTGGSNAKAKDYYEKAIALAPSEPLNYLFYALLMKNTLGENHEAYRIARLGLAHTPSSAFVESREARLALAQGR